MNFIINFKDYKFSFSIEPELTLSENYFIFEKEVYS